MYKHRTIEAVIKKADKNFNVLERLGKKTGYGSLICCTDKVVPLSKKANAISVWDI